MKAEKQIEVKRTEYYNNNVALHSSDFISKNAQDALGHAIRIDCSCIKCKHERYTEQFSFELHAFPSNELITLNCIYVFFPKSSLNNIYVMQICVQRNGSLITFSYFSKSQFFSLSFSQTVVFLTRQLRDKQTCCVENSLILPLHFHLLCMWYILHVCIFIWPLFMCLIFLSALKWVEGGEKMSWVR